MKSCFRIFLFTIVLTTFSSCLSTALNVEEEREILKQEYIALADAYFKLEKYDESLDILFKAETIGINNNGLHYKIARTAAFAKEWTVSLTYYNTILLEDPQNLMVKKSLAWVFAQSGDLEQSKKLYSDLYTEYSFDKEINKNYILVLIALEEIERAQFILDDYITLYPDDDVELLQEKISKYRESETTEE